MACRVCNDIDCGIKLENQNTSESIKNHDLNVVESLLQQQATGSFCDVTLNFGDTLQLPAHKCVIVLRSRYFASLFASPLTKTDTKECLLPDVDKECASLVLAYLYTGRADIDLKIVEGILTLADFLCIQDLVDACSDFLCKKLSCELCPFVLNTAEKFLLADLKSYVLEFLVSRIKQLLQDATSLTFSHLSVSTIFNSDQTRFVRESDMVAFLLRWLNEQERVQNSVSRAAVCHFLEATDVSYLSQAELQNILILPNTVEPLKDLLTTAWAELDTTADSDEYKDVLICRGRGAQAESRSPLYAYDLRRQLWFQLRDPEELLVQLCDVESVFSWGAALYVLTSRAEDFCGYLHRRLCTKRLFKLDLIHGFWTEMPAPSLCGERSRLFALSDSLWVMDYMGIAEMLDQDGEWKSKCRQGFLQQGTIYFLPVAVQDRLYVLQVLGGASHMLSDSFEDWLVLYVFDNDEGGYKMVSQIGAEEVNLGSREKVHGYVAYRDKIVFKNGLSENRVQVELRPGQWSPLTRQVTCYVPVADIWGYAQFCKKTYMVGQNSLSRHQWLFYDWGKRRFKESTPPPACLSGMLVYARVSATAFGAMTTSIDVMATNMEVNQTSTQATLP